MISEETLTAAMTIFLPVLKKRHIAWLCMELAILQQKIPDFASLLIHALQQNTIHSANYCNCAYGKIMDKPEDGIDTMMSILEKEGYPEFYTITPLERLVANIKPGIPCAAGEALLKFLPRYLPQSE